MLHKRRRKIEEACKETGIEREAFFEFILRDWIKPAHLPTLLVDDEDIDRTRLIVKLRRQFGVNDEAIPIILQLIDEIRAMRSTIGID